MDQKEFAINIVKSFVADCAKSGLIFERVFLFGSYANGRAHDWSDIDLLLFSKQFTKDTLRNLKLYSKVNIKFPIIETHAYPTDYLLSGDEFINDVLKDAVEIN